MAPETKRSLVRTALGPWWVLALATASCAVTDGSVLSLSANASGGPTSTDASPTAVDSAVDESPVLAADSLADSSVALAIDGAGDQSFSTSTQAAHGTLVPLYAWPPDPSWTQLAAEKQAHPRVPIVAAVNYNSGPPPAGTDTFVKGMSALQSAGVIVIGYVYTSQGARAAANVQADIDAWRAFYPNIDGIFFDGGSSDNSTLPYYQGLSSYARSRGLSFNALDIAWHIPADFAPLFEAINCWESGMLPAISFLDQEASHESINAITPYNVASYDAAFVAAAKKDVKYIYITSAPLNPSPWTILPSYFDPLLTDLESP